MRVFHISFSLLDPVFVLTGAGVNAGKSVDEPLALFVGDPTLKQLSVVWNELRQAQQFTDATLICCDGVSFPVHRTVLAAYSKYFR